MALTQTEYRKTRTGDRVVAVRELHNGTGSVPAGTVLTVEGKFSGFTAISDNCGACGVRLRFRRVPANLVDFEHRCPACAAACVRAAGDWACTRRSCGATTSLESDPPARRETPA